MQDILRPYSSAAEKVHLFLFGVSIVFLKKYLFF